MKMNKVVFFIAAAISFGVSASTQTKVDSWFNNMNYVNVTNPGVYEGQTARYATLGGISTRAPITQPFQFVNIQTPKFTAGCGGIDLYAGGFSAIDADEFVNNLRAIGQNAQSLAFMLAIQIVSPQLSGELQKIQSYADQFKLAAMDSCEAATQLMGGAMDYMGNEESVCTIKRMSQFGEDWNKANYKCTLGGGRQQTKAAGDPNTVEFIEGNLTWYVMMQDPFFSNDTEFAEVVLNLAGTLILADASNSEDTEKLPRIISPALSKESKTERFNNIYKALLYGTNATDNLQIYRCQPMSNDIGGCKTMSNNLVQITPNWVGLHQRIETMVTSIISKIRNDQQLSQEERGLVSSTTIPLYRYLTATAAYFPIGADTEKLTDQYTQLIAKDILFRHLVAVLERVELNAVNSKNIGNSAQLDTYREELKSAMDGLAKLRDANEATAEDYFTMQDRIRLYEQGLISKLGSKMVTSTLWGR